MFSLKTWFGISQVPLPRVSVTVAEREHQRGPFLTELHPVTRSVMRVILDSSLLIADERERFHLSGWLYGRLPEPVAVSVIPFVESSMSPDNGYALYQTPSVKCLDATPLRFLFLSALRLDGFI